MFSRALRKFTLGFGLLKSNNGYTLKNMLYQKSTFVEDARLVVARRAFEFFLKNEIIPYCEKYQAKNKTKPSIFISYAWAVKDKDSYEEDVKYQEYVKSFANDLQLSGFETYFDVWHDRAGALLNNFIHKMEQADYILPIGTHLYLEKFNKKDTDENTRQHVVKSEIQIMNYLANLNEHHNKKIVPILFQGNSQISLPLFLRDKIPVSFVDCDYFEAFFKLLRDLYLIDQKDQEYANLQAQFKLVLSQLEVREDVRAKVKQTQTQDLNKLNQSVKNNVAGIIKLIELEAEEKKLSSLTIGLKKTQSTVNSNKLSQELNIKEISEATDLPDVMTKKISKLDHKSIQLLTFIVLIFEEAIKLELVRDFVKVNLVHVNELDFHKMFLNLNVNFSLLEADNPNIDIIRSILKHKLMSSVCSESFSSFDFLKNIVDFMVMLYPRNEEQEFLPSEVKFNLMPHIKFFYSNLLEITGMLDEIRKGSLLLPMQNMLCDGLYAYGKLDEQNEILHAKLAIEQSRFGERSYEVGNTISMLAANAGAAGRFQEALTYSDQACSIFDSIDTPAGRLVKARTVLYLSAYFAINDKLDEAIKYGHQALEILTEGSQNNLIKSVILNNLGWFYLFKGAREQSEAFFISAVQCEKVHALAHCSYGLFLLSKSQHNEAMKQFQLSLDKVKNSIKFPYVFIKQHSQLLDENLQKELLASPVLYVDAEIMAHYQIIHCLLCGTNSVQQAINKLEDLVVHKEETHYHNMVSYLYDKLNVPNQKQLWVDRVAERKRHNDDSAQQTHKPMIHFT